MAYETAEDLVRLQQLIDESYRRGGQHLLSIHTPERRPRADRIADRLAGMCLLSLATVSSDCRPLASPVDGLFFRGEFWFGSARDSLRFRHIARNHHVSATHIPEEAFGVTVHGIAHPVELKDHPEFVEYCREIYPQWDEWTSEEAIYARIEANRFFCFELDPRAG